MYLDTMVSNYQSGVDTMGEELATMLRDQTPAGDKKESKDDNGKKKSQVKGEVKAGAMKVVTANPKKALETAMMKIVDDYKVKADTTNQAIAALVELDRLGQEGMYVYNLVVNKGIPESIIVESTDKKLKEFSYSAKFTVIGG